MLTALHIQDIVLIDQLSLSLEEGLTALTGETGAGKSILLDALGLACGAKAKRAAVRQGAKQGIVTVAFEPPSNHPVWQVLEENGLDNDDALVILRRVQSADGRGRGFVNDQPVSISMLKTVGESLLEIHGQHDGRGFLTASTHRDLLDEFGGHHQQVADVKAQWAVWQSAVSDLETKQRERDQALREADYLSHVVGELAALAPVAGEEENLAGERAERIAAEKMLEDVRSARDLLDDDAIETRLARSLRLLSAAQSKLNDTDPRFSAIIDKLDVTISELMEVRALVNDLTGQIDPDPETLSRIEERLFALRAAARKHGVAPEGLPDFFTRAKASLALLEEGETAFGDLEQRATLARKAYSAAAEKLSKNRHKIAKILDKAVASELAPLKLGRAIFSTQINTALDEPGAEGIDHVEFMVATNPGAPAGPLKTIASGGELSRFVLAMKAALATKENRTVIIFDEVDAGVGGAVADAVGERLSRLASDAQVLVVTHSPQVAARAQSHWQVSKEQKKAETLTRVFPLEADDRVEEIARMLSGASVTEQARAAASTLLTESGIIPTKSASQNLAKSRTSQKKAS